jgi:hypothetical protein
MALFAALPRLLSTAWWRTAVKGKGESAQMRGFQIHSFLI